MTEPTLWSQITEVATNFMTLLGTVCTSLLGNQMFLIMLGLVIVSVAVAYGFRFAKSIRGRGRRR